MAAAVTHNSDKTAASLDAMRSEIADQREQIQADTRAVLAVLDELRGGGVGPSPAEA